MRYVVETVLNADIDNLQKIFPLKNVLLIEDDVFSFEHSSQNTYLINDLSENPAISRVYTEESYQKLNKYASLSTASLTFKLLWYGQCGKFDSENGDTLNLLPHKDKLIEVWKKSPDTKNFVSWNSKMHSTSKQPFSTIKEGNLYFVKLDKSTTLQIKGLEDTNSTQTLGTDDCDFNTTTSTDTLTSEYNLIWYGVCGKNSNDIVNLASYSNILEVYQFSEKGNAINGVYYATDSSKSTISKLKFGNGYFVKLKKNTVQKIEGCVVSEHVELASNKHPLRLKHCKTETSTTPTPASTPTPDTLICCSDSSIKMTIEDGKTTTPKNYVSVTHSKVNGTLCWTEIKSAGTAVTYNCPLEVSDWSKGGFVISVQGSLQSNVFRFQAEDGTCYEATLTNNGDGVEQSSGGGTLNVFKKIGKVEVTPKPQPTPTSKPTPTPKNSTCCDSGSGITITKGMADASNPSGPNGITITGFQEGGLLCVGDLTETAELTSCFFKTSDNSFGGLITVSFKLTDANIKYRATNGKCYKGTIQNSTEPQTLTEV